MRRRPYGPEAWLVDDLDDPAAWAAGLRSVAPDAVIEIVPAETTVLVVVERAAHAEVGGLLDVVVAADAATSGAELVIDVVYDGADLDEVAERVSLPTDEVVALHQAATYRVAFCGFSPGFAYLTGLDERLRLPRRSRPRTSVPAGSVAIAAGYACVYPSASPGGWHLLGRTTAPIWDAARQPPAMLQPGDRVRFRQVEP